jgi:hypothetical protein
MGVRVDARTLDQRYGAVPPQTTADALNMGPIDHPNAPRMISGGRRRGNDRVPYLQGSGLPLSRPGGASKPISRILGE